MRVVSDNLLVQNTLKPMKKSQNEVVHRKSYVILLGNTESN